MVLSGLISAPPQNPEPEQGSLRPVPLSHSAILKYSRDTGQFSASASAVKEAGCSEWKDSLGQRDLPEDIWGVPKAGIEPFPVAKVDEDPGGDGQSQVIPAPGSQGELTTRAKLRRGLESVQHRPASMHCTLVGCGHVRVSLSTTLLISCITVDLVSK